MMTRRRVVAGASLLTALGTTLVAPAPVNGLSTVAALKYGDVGLYGTVRLPLSEWVDRADFFIVQGRPKAPVLSRLPEACRTAHAAGARVIVDAIFSFRKKEGVALLPARMATYQDRLAAMLDPLDPRHVYAVTLGEENVTKKGGDAVLRNLYRWAKARYPDLSVYQWYSPTKRRLNIPGRQWSALPADGWVVDHYEMDGSRYRELIEGWTSIGVPVVNLIWLSPDWWLGHSREESLGWWDARGWRVLYEQLAVSQRFELPTAFFAFFRGVRGETGPRFMGEVEDARGAPFLDAMQRDLFATIRSRAPIPLPVPETRPTWIPPWSDLP